MLIDLFVDDSSTNKDQPQAEKPEKTGLFKKLLSGLKKTRQNLNNGFNRLVGAHAKLDDSFMDELEEVLLSADVGLDLTTRIIENLRADVKANLLKTVPEVIEFIKKELEKIVTFDEEEKQPSTKNSKPLVVLVIGVNGAGKTTTIGKLSFKLKKRGKSVLLAAGDTFRAAAADQLETWAERSEADFIRSNSGSDPSAVVFDAVKLTVSRGHDVMIADTAGRLHSKVNLMEELKKIKRIMSRELPGAPHETLLVLDSTTGQNAVSQAKIFNESIGVTGIVLTKLDGTAKGGVVINIVDTLKLPVQFIGIGEKIDDLRPFNPKEFVAAIFEGTTLTETKESE